MRATEIASILAQRTESVCQHLLPLGRANKGEWCCGSLSGEPGNSLKVRLDGSKAGVWSDFAAGDKGDLIGLWMRVRRVDIFTACEQAMEWLGVPELERNRPAPNNYVSKPTIVTRPPSPTWLRLQSAMRVGTITELDELAKLRKLPASAGVHLASSRGQLFFADVFDDGYEWPAWIVTDGSRRNAQARRCDGKPWDGIGGKKAKTIAGCEASWPIGINEAKLGQEIALVEGGPDFLAAWHAIWDREKVLQISPVAMLGAGQPIHASALPIFAGRTVWLFPHSDDNLAGQKAAEAWSTQLRSVGAKPHQFRVGDHGMKDLNDLIAAQGMEAHP